MACPAGTLSVVIPIRCALDSAKRRSNHLADCVAWPSTFVVARVRNRRQEAQRKLPGPHARTGEILSFGPICTATLRSCFDVAPEPDVARDPVEFASFGVQVAGGACGVRVRRLRDLGACQPHVGVQILPVEFRQITGVTVTGKIRDGGPKFHQASSQFDTFQHRHYSAPSRSISSSTNRPPNRSRMARF